MTTTDYVKNMSEDRIMERLDELEYKPKVEWSKTDYEIHMMGEDETDMLWQVIDDLKDEVYSLRSRVKDLER